METENPTDFLFHVILPIGFSLLILSFVASVCLQFLGNYHTLFQWSMKVISCCPIVHACLLQDSIINDYKKIDDLFTEVIKYDPDIINKKDPVFGETPMISAAQKNLHDLLRKMIDLRGNIYITNFEGENVWTYWKINTDQKMEIEQKYINTPKIKVRTQQPMHKAVIQNKIRRLCFYKTIGGQWGAHDGNIRVIRLVLDQLKGDKLNLNDCNAFVKLMLRNAEDTNGGTLIHLAAYNGKALKALIDNKFSVHERDSENGKTPLFSAALNNHEECVKILIEHGADVNAKAFDKHSPLHLAAKFGATKCAQLMIENNADINCKDIDGWTPLHYAAKKGHIYCLKLLIDNRAEINCKTLNGRTPLHHAAHQGHIECLKHLIDNRAEINCKTLNGWTPLHFAAVKGYIECLKHLIDNRAEINCKEIKGFTPLHFAAHQGHIDCLKLLIDHRAEINCESTNGFTPLYQAGAKGHNDCMKLLIEKGADVNIQNKYMETALFLITFSKNTSDKLKDEGIEMLIRAGADLNLKGKDNETPLDYKRVKQLKEKNPELFRAQKLK